MQIGYFTPPVGMNLFIASYRFGKPITTLYRATLPFMAVLIVALLLITYIPWLSLGLI
jgi:TRAP-type C4-dicarboxylate transport system permease large subunit